MGAATAIARESAPARQPGITVGSSVDGAMQPQTGGHVLQMYPDQSNPVAMMHPTPSGDTAMQGTPDAQPIRMTGAQQAPMIQRQEATGTTTPGRFRRCDEGQQRMITRHQPHAIDWVTRTMRSIDGIFSGATTGDDRGRFMTAYFLNFDMARIQRGSPLTADDFRTAGARLRTIRSNYETILSGLRNIDYACFPMCPENEYAAHSVYDIETDDGLTLTLPRSYVRLCPLWFNAHDFFIRVSVLIHEVVHRDLLYRNDTYEWQPEYREMGWSVASSNPDSYAVFARMIYHFNRDDMGPGSRPSD